MHPNLPKVKNVIFFYPYPQHVDTFAQKYQKPYLFKKYFPKYLKNLTIDFISGAVKSQVKRAKVIHDLKSAEFTEKSSYWRVLLSNKMKTVKTLSNYFKSTIVFLQKVKLFSGLKSIQLAPLDDYGEFDYFLHRKANKKMLALPKLQYLKIEIYDLPQYYLYFLEDLNSLPKLLKSVKVHLDLFKAPEGNTIRRLDVLKTYQNFMRNLTSFWIEGLATPEDHKAFKGLAESCPNLRHLSFEFSCRSIINYRGGGKGFSKTRLPIHANCIKEISKFQNLRSLDLKIADNEAFLNHFVLPTGVRWLSLEFEEDLASETLQQINGSSLKSFEGNSALVKFFGNFERLENLETLKLAFSEGIHPDSYANQNELSRCIIKRLPHLKKLVFARVQHKGGPGESKDDSPIEENDSLPKLLESCPQTLETLEIKTHEKVLYSERDFSSLQNKFASLKTIKFNGRFHRDSPKLVSSFLQQLISLGESIAKIEFTAIFGDEEFFFGLFEELEKVKVPDQLKVNIKIKPIKGFYGYEYCGDKLKESTYKEKLQQKICQGISLVIYTDVQDWHMTEVLESFAERFDSFRVIFSAAAWFPHNGRTDPAIKL